MPITQHALIRPGLLVSIVLKADQRTGRQVQGVVSQLLTRSNHPRGIKVKLVDGRVGRVQQILPQPSAQRQHHTAMSSNNPWADAQSPFSPSSPNARSNDAGAAQSYYQSNLPHQPSQPNQPNQQSQTPHHQPWQSAPPQPLGGRPSDSEQLLAQEGDRAAQVEHMQQYEANAPQRESDRIQAQLQQEFPNIDSSLIAAIYGERPGNLPEVRELLQELSSG